MENITLLLLCCLFASLLFSGCATILAPKYQKVTITTNTPGAVITEGKDTLGIDSATVMCDKKKLFVGCEVAKKGFKIRTYCFQLRHVSPAAAFIVLDVAIAAAMFLGFTVSEFGMLGVVYFLYSVPVDLGSPKIRAYSSNQYIPALLPMEHRKANEKKLQLDSVIFALPAGKMKFISHASIRRLYSYLRPKAYFLNRRNVKERDHINITAVDFRETMNGVLAGLDFTDTTQPKKSGSSLHLTALVREANLHTVRPFFSHGVGNFTIPLALEVAIDWNVIDANGKVIKTIRTDEVSDLHVITRRCESWQREELAYKLLQDNVEYTFLKLKAALIDNKLLVN